METLKSKGETMEILYLITGGLLVFIPFYIGIVIGLKMAKDKPVELPKIKTKTSKLEETFAEGLNNIINYTDEVK